MRYRESYFGTAAGSSREENDDVSGDRFDWVFNQDGENGGPLNRAYFKHCVYLSRSGSALNPNSYC